jgi:hypothetical protein
MEFRMVKRTVRDWDMLALAGYFSAVALGGMLMEEDEVFVGYVVGCWR